MTLSTRQKEMIGGGLVIGGLGYYYYTKTRQKTAPVTKTSRSTVTSTQTRRTTPTRTVTRTNRVSTSTSISTAPSTSQCQSLNALGASNGFVTTATPAQAARMVLTNAQYQGHNAATGSSIYAKTLVTPSDAFIRKSLGSAVSSACVAAVTQWVQHYIKTNPPTWNALWNNWWVLAYKTYGHNYHIYSVTPGSPMITLSLGQSVRAHLGSGLYENRWMLHLAPNNEPSLNIGGENNNLGGRYTHIALLITDPGGRIVTTQVWNANTSSILITGNQWVSNTNNNPSYTPLPGDQVRVATLTYSGGDLYLAGLWSSPLTLPTPTTTTSVSGLARI